MSGTFVSGAPAGGAPGGNRDAPIPLMPAVRPDAGPGGDLDMYALLACAMLLSIFGLPLVAAAEVCARLGIGSLALLVAVPTYVVAFVLVAGLLARPFVSSIVPGKFRRDLRDPAYRRRRLYGLCWTAVYYFKPLYFVCLSVPALKRLLFRLFGYRGSMDFTVYPDSWIRDLPLLDFGPGAYVSNRATIGTNVALRNGTLLVDRVTLGPRAMVGHLAMLSTGVSLEEGAEVGVGCAVGSKCVLRKDADLAPCCAMGHLAELGAGARVGFMSWVGSAARVGPGVVLPPHTSLPNRARVEDAEAAAQFLSSAIARLSDLGARLAAGRPPADPIPPARFSGDAAPGAHAGPSAHAAPADRLAPQGLHAATGTDGPAGGRTNGVSAASFGDSAALRSGWNRFE